MVSVHRKHTNSLISALAFMSNCSIWDSITLKQVRRYHLHTYLRIIWIWMCVCNRFRRYDIPSLKGVNKYAKLALRLYWILVAGNNRSSEVPGFTHIALFYSVQYVFPNECLSNTSIHNRPLLQQKHKRKKQKEKWNKVEWCQLLCHLSLSWL